MQPGGTFTSAIFDVCKSKTNYQYCTLSEEAQFAAFASADGMKYRVINLENGNLINELTRGSTSAVTTSLCLSQNKKNPIEWYLSASTLKAKTHVFLVKIGEGETNNANTRSALYSVSSVLPSYFSQEFSFAQY